MRLTRTDTQNSTIFVEAADLKAYLRVDVPDFDDELKAAIESATQRVENGRNVSLRTQSMRLSTRSDERGYIELYYPKITAIVSVKGVDGSDLTHSWLEVADKIRIAPQTDAVVDYRVVACENATAHKQAVIGIASLIFDGETDEQAYKMVVKQWV